MVKSVSVTRYFDESVRFHDLHLHFTANCVERWLLALTELIGIIGNVLLYRVRSTPPVLRQYSTLLSHLFPISRPNIVDVGEDPVPLLLREA